MGEETLPVEVWADMLEDESQDTDLLRAWLLTCAVDNYDDIVRYRSHGHSPTYDDTYGNYGRAGSTAVFGNGNTFYVGRNKREIGNGGGHVAR